MKIAIFGATGTIGSRILKEALRREHEVTMVVRDPSKLAEATPNERLHVKRGDLLMPQSVAEAAAGHEVVISAYGPRFGAEDELLEVARSLVEGVKKAHVHRLLVVGGAGSLEASPGVLLMDTPAFPEEIKPLARAHAKALEIYQASDIDWTYLSPPAAIEPGDRTGMFRIGTTRVILDELDNSRISAEDYAVALLDEIEDAQFIRERFTVAY
ncbi:3-beta hydroxysteroid dehydrogenase [Paenibacillus yonginensis]|uniref:3-beta hydroxysteroid dehydrogenase n=1 Tax=Paenibacillus yonginensis TaxID=1462996 RepID=A0A1B1N5W9_9BACL|nr:NAD(P)-dependent oxidoreductase [Paenibacillus yonginensis]ANS76775.1 3-beta hydroxysteroid dehydrogenase [Paenibacillus yonginensis]